MQVAVEISLYPLSDDFEKPVDTFLSLLANNKTIEVEPGKMSSILTGELSDIMQALALAMEQVFVQSPAVFNLKISNCCPV
ncbi:YkoF family thiamine/hydroxymethylpyrimidine-binding protein [uncultured Draconibacterium sp.]|uniref:YkoF family thiamine/hydroxymethylpyrimidine-binding protein n=1 Tax=uncultured Draconibacterium sp. TaxID=1573823 RepID=UPI0025FFCC0D|nr:YkoF family thiamine/hydroxymethylpyrimidine-binding protein [uncultured Draconibacterium sp.]